MRWPCKLVNQITQIDQLAQLLLLFLLLLKIRYSKLVIQPRKIELDNTNITLTDYNKFLSDLLDTKIKENTLVNKSDLNEEIKILAKNQVEALKAEQDRIKITRIWQKNLSIKVTLAIMKHKIS